MNKTYRKYFTLIYIICISIGTYAQDLNHAFKPGQVWPDNEGKQINAHGGAIIFHNGTYFWFGEYIIPRTEKDKTHYGVSCYSSKDLLNWKNEGLAFSVSGDTSGALKPGSLIKRPRVIYNNKTGKFVMWFNHELKGKEPMTAFTGVAVGDKVTGPYRYVKSLRPDAGTWPVNLPEKLKKAETNEDLLKKRSEEWMMAVKDGLLVRRDFKEGQMAGDLTLFVDKDGKAYHIHESEDNMALHISELTDDYLDFTGKYIRILAGESDSAPVIFYAKGKYYIITSGVTGWKPNPGQLSVSKKIMGEWKITGNPFSGIDQIKLASGTQGSQVLQVNKGKTAFIFLGDKWIPENPANSRYVWLPVEWEKGNPVIRWYPRWTMDTYK